MSEVRTDQTRVLDDEDDTVARTPRFAPAVSRPRGVLADVLYRRTKAARLWLLTASLLGCAPFLHYLGNSDTLAATRLAAMGFGLFSGFFMGNIFPSAFEIVPADARPTEPGRTSHSALVIAVLP